MLRVVFTVSALSLLCASAFVSAADRYIVTDLGLLPGGVGDVTSHAHGISNPDAMGLVQVTGISVPEPWVPRGFMWEDGLMSDIGALRPGWTETVPHAINDFNVIVGFSKDHDIYGPEGFYWDGGPPSFMVPLDPLPNSDFEYTSGNAVSNQTDPESPWYYTVGVSRGLAVIWWTPEDPQSLGTLGGDFSAALGINNRPIDDGLVVVGYAANSSGSPRAFMWTLSEGMIDLGLLEAHHWQSGANDVNDSGAIVGDSGTDDLPNLRAVLWDNGGMTDLGVGTAVAINEDGTIIGNKLSGSLGRAVSPFVVQGGIRRDLQDLIGCHHSPWTMVSVADINDDGQIVGSAIFDEGGANEWRAVLLTPATLIPGDANMDGCVDGEDYLIWQANNGMTSGATWCDGDFNGDGRVDGEDFLIWQAHNGMCDD